jgi:UTP:GlnB (protein PII) uridylyltransferase
LHLHSKKNFSRIDSVHDNASDICLQCFSCLGIHLKFLTFCRVIIDNDSNEDATLVKVNSANTHGILLEVVQVLTDLDLNISKAYIASDGGWFMDVFHVTDQQGNKIQEGDVLDNIEKVVKFSYGNSL